MRKNALRSRLRRLWPAAQHQHIGHKIGDLLLRQRFAILAVHQAILKAAGQEGIRIDDACVQILFGALPFHDAASALANIVEVGAQPGWRRLVLVNRVTAAARRLLSAR